MVATIRRWGNSLGLRIPKALAREVRLRDGGGVRLRASRGRLVVEPIPENRKVYDLESLLAGVTSHNLHAATSWGAPAGKEVW